MQKGMGTPAIIALIAVVVVALGAAYVAMMPEGEKMMGKGHDMAEEGDKMMQDGEAMKDAGEQMMQDGDKMMHGDDGDAGFMSPAGVSYYGDVLAQSPDGAVLLDFNQSDYENAIANEKLVVLFFYANWCPICAEEFPKMEEAFKELPAGVVGFRVNFNDSETDSYEKGLASQFGVAYQHTKVFVKNGARVLKAPDSWDTARFISEITNAL